MQFQVSGLPGYSDTELLEEIRRVVEGEFAGVPPNPTMFAQRSRVSVSTLRKRFGGSYASALAKAGFNYAPVGVNPPLDQVKDNLLQVLRRSGGERFSQEFYVSHGGTFKLGLVKRLFGGTWNSVMIGIGARPKPRIIHVSRIAQQRRLNAQQTEAEVFNELRRVWQLVRRRPTQTEFYNLTSISPSVCYRLFGSWKRTIEAYCRANGVLLQNRPRTHVTPDLLLSELRAVQSKRPNELLTYDDYNQRGGTYSIGTFQNHFGGWTQAVQAAGGFSGKQGKHSTAALLDEIQRLWEALGRAPTWRDMRLMGLFSPKSFERRFGSWRKALHAFCHDRASEPDEQRASDSKQDPESWVAKMSQAPFNEPEAKSTAPVIVQRTGRNPSIRLRFRIMKRDNFTCRACGRSPATEVGVILHVDHVLAYSRGGETLPENLQTLCEKCNLGKSDL
jgi:Homing endonuclease associated repeat/HNH endonuclease